MDGKSSQVTGPQAVLLSVIKVGQPQAGCPTAEILDVFISQISWNYRSKLTFAQNVQYVQENPVLHSNRQSRTDISATQHEDTAGRKTRDFPDLSH